MNCPFCNNICDDIISPSICQVCQEHPKFWLNHNGDIYWIRFEFKNNIVSYNVNGGYFGFYSGTHKGPDIVSFNHSIPIKDVLNQAKRLLNLKAFL